MGLCFSQDDEFGVIKDKYKTLEQVTLALEKSGLESSNLVIGIDYTGSNQVKGEKTFGGKSLHHVEIDAHNPYQKVINVVGRTLSKFDEDNLIPCYGFGDINTRNFGVFSICEPGKICVGFEQVLKRYSQITPKIDLNGPTNFAPIINKAIECVCENGRLEYHILVIICDGEVDNLDETTIALKNAANYPLSIIAVGVGDGPFGKLTTFDDMKGRKFDNFQFVDYAKVTADAKKRGKDPDVEFAVNALMEIPDQYKAIRKLGYLGKKVEKKKSSEINIFKKQNTMLVPNQI